MYLDKKHEVVSNNISHLVDRQNTMKKRGLKTPSDIDIEMFKFLNKNQTETKTILYKIDKISGIQTS